jgi:Tfp pilus assembly protein PilF
MSMFSVALQKIDTEAPYQQTWVMHNESLNRDQFEAYVYKLRAIAFMQQGDRQSCIADLTEAIKRCPNDASSYIARSDAYQQSNMPDEAEADYERAQALGYNP